MNKFICFTIDTPDCGFNDQMMQFNAFYKLGRALGYRYIHVPFETSRVSLYIAINIENPNPHKLKPMDIYEFLGFNQYMKTVSEPNEVECDWDIVDIVLGQQSFFSNADISFGELLNYVRGCVSERASGLPVVEFLDTLLLSPMSVGITDIIYMEILQGARDEAGYRKLQKYFSTQQFYRFAEPQNSYEAAALMFLQCRRGGVTVRSSIDCLIAQCAFENELVLLHHDKDFVRLAEVVPGLRQKCFLS